MQPLGGSKLAPKSVVKSGHWVAMIRVSILLIYQWPEKKLIFQESVFFITKNWSVIWLHGLPRLIVVPNIVWASHVQGILGCTPIPTWRPVMGNPYTSPISRGYSGQISIIPKPEFFGDFGEIPLQSPPFGVTKEVAIIWPGLIQVSAHPLSNPRCLWGLLNEAPTIGPWELQQHPSLHTVHTDS